MCIVAGSAIQELLKWCLSWMERLEIMAAWDSQLFHEESTLEKYDIHIWVQEFYLSSGTLFMWHSYLSIVYH